jgi:hypothetical protein
MQNIKPSSTAPSAQIYKRIKSSQLAPIISEEGDHSASLGKCHPAGQAIFADSQLYK